MPTSSEGPVPLRLRVLVKGASTVNWISPMGGPRSDMTFPRQIEAELGRRGRDAEVQAITMTSEQTKNILLTWQREVLGFSPDVIVLVYGHYETIHLFVPRWLEWHANSLRVRPRKVSRLYRAKLVRPGWMAIARMQARLDIRFGRPTLDKRLSRAAADIETYVKHVQEVGSPLVFVFELLPPAGKFRSWFPGMAGRITVMNTLLKNTVERIDKPNVRYFPVQPLVDEYAGGDIEIATPDGFHYNPEIHRQVGIALAGEIETWALTQPHLTTTRTTAKEA